MKSTKRMLVLALGTVAFLPPTSAVAQTSGVQIWTNRCGSCHATQPANRYTAEKWESIMTHMALTARLTTAQSDAVLDFLKSGARQTTAMEEGVVSPGLMVASVGGTYVPATVGPDDVFRSNCVPCHGKSGKGDGPAAGAFDPRPADLTDPEYSNRSAEELARMISTGGGGMPAFAATLPPEEIEAVAEYVRSL